MTGPEKRDLVALLAETLGQNATFQSGERRHFVRRLFGERNPWPRTPALADRHARHKPVAAAKLAEFVELGKPRTGDGFRCKHHPPATALPKLRPERARTEDDPVPLLSRQLFHRETDRLMLERAAADGSGKPAIGIDEKACTRFARA